MTEHQYVTIRNAKGQTRTITARAWNLMKNAKDGEGNTRKGWTKIDAGQKPVPIVTGQRPKGALPFVPPEIEEAQRQSAIAETERVSAMISGNPTKPSNGSAKPIAQAKAETAEVSAEDAGADDKSRAFKGIPGLTAKAEKALGTIGITTFVQLAEANPAEVNKALDAVGLGPKKAQVPNWKMKAKQLVAQ